MIDIRQLTSFKKIVPCETGMGQIFIRTITVAEQVALEALKDKDFICQKLATQCCDEDGNSVLTPEQAGLIESTTAHIILKSINELNTSIEKKSLQTSNS